MAQKSRKNINVFLIHFFLDTKLDIGLNKFYIWRTKIIVNLYLKVAQVQRTLSGSKRSEVNRFNED